MQSSPTYKPALTNITSNKEASKEHVLTHALYNLMSLYQTEASSISFISPGVLQESYTETDNFGDHTEVYIACLQKLKL